MRKLNISLLKKNIENRAKDDFEKSNISALSIIVCQNNEVVYKNCFGTIVPNGTEPLNENSIFRLASMTKPITAVAIMILAERGLLKLSDLVEDYLPSFKDMQIAVCDENGNMVDVKKSAVRPNILHLLTHTSGIGNGVFGEKILSKMTATDKKTLDSSMDYYSKNLFMSFEPFSSTEYSAYVAFDILGKIVEIVSGTDYNEFLKKEIFIPCEMSDTTFIPDESQWKRLVSLHDKKDGKSVVAEHCEGYLFGDFPTEHYLGGAGLVSTSGDYSNFAQMLLNKGSFKNHQILSPESVKAISTPQVPESVQGGNQRWGLGVRVITEDSYGRLPVGAYGWSGAYGTHFWVDPANNVTAVFMRNTLYDGGVGAVAANNFEIDVNNSLVEN